MASDSVESLEIQKLIIEGRIREARSEGGREAGSSVASLEDLTCAHHPDADFKPTGSIPDGDHDAAIRKMQGEKGTLETYSCGGCISEFGHSLMAASAYDCPTCGFVYGRYESRDYDNITILAGSSGKIHYCSVCQEELGKSIFMRS